MDAHMADKEVGDCDSLVGTLNGVPYDLFVMKDVDYSMKLMSAYGALTVKAGQDESFRTYTKDGSTVTNVFKYTEPFANHFKCRHVVDDHNNNRHSDISLEQTWATHRWENRISAFILAVVEVNTYLAVRFFVWRDQEKETPLLHFRKKLAKALIYNELLQQTSPEPRSSARKKQKLEHKIAKAPQNVNKFENGQWVCKAKNVCNRHHCRMPGYKKKYGPTAYVVLVVGYAKNVYPNTSLKW